MFKKRVYGSNFQKRGHQYMIKQRILKALALLYGVAIAYSFTLGLEVAIVAVIVPVLLWIVFED